MMPHTAFFNLCFSGLLFSLLRTRLFSFETEAHADANDSHPKSKCTQACRYRWKHKII